MRVAPGRSRSGSVDPRCLGNGHRDGGTTRFEDVDSLPQMLHGCLELLDSGLETNVAIVHDDSPAPRRRPALLPEAARDLPGSIAACAG
jgi:hypothetical protein